MPLLPDRGPLFLRQHSLTTLLLNIWGVPSLMLGILGAWARDEMGAWLAGAGERCQRWGASHVMVAAQSGLTILRSLHVVSVRVAVVVRV